MSSMDRKDSRHLGSEAELPPDRELEQYGVWVKSEPEDVEELEIERDAVDEVLPDIDDTGSLPEIGGLDPDADRFLSPEEERMLGSLDIPEDDSADDGADVSGLGEISELGAGVIDIELDDLEPAPRRDGGAPRPAPSRQDSELEVFSPEDFGVELGSETSGSAADTSSASGASAGAEDAFEPIDIDLQFDDTIPSPVVSEGEDVSFDLEDIGAPVSSGSKGFETVTEFDDFLSADEPAPADASPERNSGIEAETVDIDLDSIGGPSSDAARTGSGRVASAAPLSSMPSGSPASSFADELPELVLDESPSRDSSFDDLGAVERDLAAVPSRIAQAESSDLLKRIAEDLAGIRGELVSLKRQLNELKGSGETPVASASPDHAERAGGFFDEEEDETIALTGDELDNILNTAAFTEETAEGVADPDAANPTGTETELLPEDGDYSAPPAIEEIRLEPDTSGESGDGQDDALDSILEEGIRPITPALEDTGYLEEALEGEEPLELDAEPIEDTPLAEPDLADFDLSDEADLLGSGEDLPVLEDADGGADIALEDIPFDVPAAESPSPLGQDFGAIENIPEIEEESSEAVIDLVDGEADFELPLDDFVLEDQASDQSEINLHVEASSDDSSTGVPEPEARAAGGARPQRAVAPSAPESFEQGIEDVSELESLSESTELSDFDGVDVGPAEDESVETLSRPAAVREVPAGDSGTGDKDPLRDEVRNVLSYLDKLLDSLPDDKIEEFARSEHFETYKRLFEELGLA